MTFRSQPPPPKNEVLRSYKLRKQEFLQSLQALPDLVEVTYPDKSSYLGQINQEKLRSGRGQYTEPEGDVYFGTWKDDMYHGEGIYLYGNG